jgi:exosome complex exonuclease RRP6
MPPTAENFIMSYRSKFSLSNLRWKPNRMFEPSGELFKTKAPQIATDINSTAYIDTVPKLQEMLSELRKAPEIAVDLEHHSYQTFPGITCLIQISTRSKDFIIDTIALREDLHITNEVFTKLSIVKIFHSADSDVEWLQQRDLSLYLVNMFALTKPQSD